MWPSPSLHQDLFESVFSSCTIRTKNILLHRHAHTKNPIMMKRNFDKAYIHTPNPRSAGANKNAVSWNGFAVDDGVQSDHKRKYISHLKLATKQEPRSLWFNRGTCWMQLRSAFDCFPQKLGSMRTRKSWNRCKLGTRNVEPWKTPGWRSAKLSRSELIISIRLSGVFDLARFIWVRDTVLIAVSKQH